MAVLIDTCFHLFPFSPPLPFSSVKYVSALSRRISLIVVGPSKRLEKCYELPLRNVC